MNVGERNELLLKLKLIQLRDSKEKIILNGKETIVNSVSFDREYGILPEDLNLASIKDEKTLITFANLVGIGKSPTGSKSDVYINGKGYSVKALDCAPPAIVNHTNRKGWLRVCDVCNVSIDKLDGMIEEYWNLRLKGTIKEDTKNSDANSPFKNHKEYLRPLLNYFFFRGTGSKDSNHQADYILGYTNPLSTTTWRVYDETNYLDKIWDKIIFSLRSKKGMPDPYPNMKNKEDEAIIAKWTKLHQGSYRGALHVRAK